LGLVCGSLSRERHDQSLVLRWKLVGEHF
jgi:hypothetical protein